MDNQCFCYTPSICPNHSDHKDKMVAPSPCPSKDPQSLDAFQTEQNPIYSVTVSKEPYDEKNCCEWYGCCNLRFIGMVEGNRFEASDEQGNIYNYPYNIMLAYSAFDES